jgi:hypothetical protein
LKQLKYVSTLTRKRSNTSIATTEPREKNSYFEK